MRPPCLAAAFALALPLAASAADAADPAAPTPPPEYRSVLPGTPTDLAEPPVPWRKANADVARFPRGHADILKWEDAQEHAAPPSAPAPAQPAEKSHAR